MNLTFKPFVVWGMLFVTNNRFLKALRRMSLRRKIVLVTMGLFFLILTMFTVAMLFFSNDVLIKQEEETIRTTADLVQRHISEIDAPLTKDNLLSYFHAHTTNEKVDSNAILTEDIAVSGNHSVSHCIRIRLPICTMLIKTFFLRRVQTLAQLRLVRSMFYVRKRLTGIEDLP